MKFKFWALFLAYFAYDFLNKRLQDLLMLDLDITRSFENNISILLLFSQIASFFLYSLITYTGFFYFYPKKKWGLCVLFIILGFTVPIGVRFLIEEVLFDVLFGFTNYFQKVSFNFYVRDNSIYAFKYAPFGIAFFFIRYTLYNEKNAKQLSQLNHEMELSLLRSQINPHFLFNALNTAVSLIRLKRDDDAVQALAELSSMLRKILEHKNDSNSKVKEEIAFIKNYLCIQQMRFSDKLDVKISVDDNCLDLDIPNMLLHPLVENAVQHGSQLESNRNLVDLDVSRKDDQLLVKLTNKVAENDEHKGFGIGVSNTRDRLAKMYNDYCLDLHPKQGGFFETTLIIPISAPNA